MSNPESCEIPRSVSLGVYISKTMSSSEPFRSKKPHLHQSASKGKNQSPDPIILSSKTPEKTPQLSRRSRNRGVALSIKEVKKVAESLQERSCQQQHHDDRTGQIKSARRQIAMSCSEITPRKSKTAVDDAAKLPEKYEILAEFFDSLDSSIRLLRLKGSTPTFTNICPKIECLTDRRFTYGDLAQLKYILPEAIAIKKVLKFDERTSCMKPDLHITINPDAIESDAKKLSECGSVPLRRLFRTRLRNFIKSHPEGDEIPEEKLPEPFNYPKQDHLSNTLKMPSSFDAETSSDPCAAHPQSALTACMRDSNIVNNAKPDNREENLSPPVKMSAEALNQKPAVATHISQSFRRRFSQNSMSNKADNSHQQLPPDSFQPQAFPVSEPSLKKDCPNMDPRSHPYPCVDKLATEAASSKGCPATCSSPAHLTSSSAPPATPNKNIEDTENEDGSLRNIGAMSTPDKFASTPSRLMSVTPALPPPKRCSMSPDDNTSSSPKKLVRRPPRSRSLKFDTPVRSEEAYNEADGAVSLSIDEDIYDILPESLLQSIREKERMAMEERDPAISQAKRRQKVIASLPKLFNMIHLLFHSIKRSVMTKEELVSKIISSHCDIVDRREVEEQLTLLLELVPEWISERLASSGDLLFCINKMLNAETVRTRLKEAK